MAKSGNGNIVKWIAILVTAGFVIAGWIYSLGVQGEQLKANCKSDDIVHPQVPIIDTRVTRVEENVKSINQNISEQKTMQQQILNKQEEILWELQRP
jgi:hypothetical protein